MITIRELRSLQTWLEALVQNIEAGTMVEMTEEENRKWNKRPGFDAIYLGDFVVIRRAAWDRMHEDD
jgi:hypothetical protein